MKDKTFYCNCEPPCVHKGKIKKITVIDSKGKHKHKAQVCLNTKFVCTCGYRATIDRAFMF